MIGAERSGPGPGMIPRANVAPMLRRRCAGPQSIGAAVEAVIGRRGLGGIVRPPTPRTLGLVALALSEVLHTVAEARDACCPGGISVELWTEPGLAVFVIGYSGRPLPGWLLASWDRGEEPELPEALADCGWGWLLVREALDGVGATSAGGRQLLYLEKRL